MKIAVVINPRSGRRGHREDAPGVRVELARTLLHARGEHAEIAVTNGRGHAGELAQQLADAGTDVVVAWGGDGTVNEVAGPLIGSPTALGVVPAGSGDGLARSLGLPLEPDAALRVAFSGRTRAMDVGYLGERHFLNIGGIGFDADIAAAFNARRTRGLAGYLSVGLSRVWSYRPEACHIGFDGHTLEGPRFLVAFANGSQYGNGLLLSADADPFDGRLNLVVVDAGSSLRQLWRGRRLWWFARAPAAGVQRHVLQQATVSGDRLLCHVDGETFTASGRIDVKVAPAALRVKQ
jgi:YegS/Rv2252/BmrU family lipid kinase